MRENNNNNNNNNMYYYQGYTNTDVGISAHGIKITGLGICDNEADL